MVVSQETIWIIYKIKPTSWDMWIIQELLSTENNTRFTISIKTTMNGFMGIILIYTQKKSKHTALYYLNRT